MEWCQVYFITFITVKFNILQCADLLDFRLTVYPLCELMWTYREGATWKRNAYNDIYSGNSLNVCICLRTA